MTRRGLLTLAALATVALVCLAHRDPCGAEACRPHPVPTSPPHGAAAALGALLGVSLLVLAVRAVWGAVRVQVRLPRLELVPNPPALRAAMWRTGLDEVAVRCLASRRPTAFCAGLFRPTIHVSTGLVSRLRPGELDAVLIHEAHHAARLEPLRRLLARAAALGFFYLPLCHWWSARRAENSELGADAVASARRGRAALAGAIYALGEDTPGPDAAASFDGALELRVARLLDEPLPPRRPSTQVWVQTVTGLLAGLLVSMCLVEETGRHVISGLV